MAEVDREAAKTAMKEMIEKKEGLSKKGVPDVAVLETKLNLKGQIGANLRNELLAEIKPKATTEKTATPKPTALKEEETEKASAAPSKVKKTSIVTIRDGVPHRIYFENGQQVKAEKVKLEG